MPASCGGSKSSSSLARVPGDDCVVGLRFIDLSDCWRISDEGLRALGAASSELAASLESLDLSAAYEIGDEGICGGVASLLPLRALSIRSCWRVTGTGLSALARSLSRLEFLD